MFQDLSERVQRAADDLKTFIESTQNNYVSSQKLVPNDLLNKVTDISFLSHIFLSISSAKNDRIFGRIGNVRITV